MNLPVGPGIGSPVYSVEQILAHLLPAPPPRATNGHVDRTPAAPREQVEARINRLLETDPGFRRVWEESGDDDQSRKDLAVLGALRSRGWSKNDSVVAGKYCRGYDDKKSNPDYYWNLTYSKLSSNGNNNQSAVGPHLSDQFWGSLPELTWLRQYFRSRRVGPDVGLGTFLARFSAAVDHQLKLNNGCVSWASALVGPTGGGKTDANKAVRELFKTYDLGMVENVLNLGPASGEGFLSAFMGPVVNGQRAQSEHNAFIFADEGEQIDRAGDRQGSTIWSIFCSLWAGASAASTLADKAKSRYIEGGTYSIGFCVGWQPRLFAERLKNSDTGVPSRFCCFHTGDPECRNAGTRIPPPFRWKKTELGDAVQLRLDGSDGPTVQLAGEFDLAIDPSVQSEVREIQLSVLEGSLVYDNEFDSHRNWMKLRCAGLLTLLQGKRTVGKLEWSLAEIVIANSEEVRAHVLAGNRAAQSAKNLADRKKRLEESLELEEAKLALQDKRKVDAVAKRVLSHLKQAGASTRRGLSQHLGRDYKHLDEALALLAKSNRARRSGEDWEAV